MFNDLISAAMHSTPAAFVGVTAIALYFLLIMGTAIMRIKKADHMDHHDH